MKTKRETNFIKALIFNYFLKENYYSIVSFISKILNFIRKYFYILNIKTYSIKTI